MKTYKNLYSKALSDEVIDEAFRVAIKRKRLRPSVDYIIRHYDKCKTKIKEFIQNGDFRPFVHKAVEINDGFKLKKRTIIQPYFSPRRPEQWLQHIVVQILKPIFLKGMYVFRAVRFPRGAFITERNILKNSLKHIQKKFGMY